MTDPADVRSGADSSSVGQDPNRAGPLDSDVATGLLQRGQELTEKSDWDLGAATFARVVGNSDPSLHTAALLGLAECRYRLDDEEGALQAWITATQAPENPLTWRAWKALAAARVRSDDMTGAARAYREAERRAPGSEQAEINARIGWLTKESGDEGASGRAFSRSRSGTMAQPIVTWTLLAVTIGVGISMFLLDQRQPWLDLLALDKVAVGEGEYWRLLTPVLVHGSLLHLGFNMYALWIIGPLVETLYGSARFLGIYLLCAAAGSAASYVFSDARFSVGASGAVFGLFGVLLVADRVHKPALTRFARNLTMQIGVLIAINLVIGFSVPGIDNGAHIGGLLAGSWLGFVMIPQGATTLGSLWSRPSATPSEPQVPDELRPVIEPAKLVRPAGVAALVVVVVVMVLIGPI